MALGVFALVLVLSVMNGFDHELKQRLLRAIPHATLEAKGGLKNWQSLSEDIASTEGLVASSPYVGGHALISKGAIVDGISLQGVSPNDDARVSPIAQYLVRGDYAALKEGEFGIVLGSLLAYNLGTFVGDKVTVTLPKISITLAGAFPRSRQFRVVGVFEVGAQVDQSLALIHLNDAQKLFRLGDKVSGLRLKFDDLYTAPTAVKSLQSSLGERYSLKDWSQTQGSLFQAVKLEKTVTGILLSIVIAVAAFNIITSLIMMVTEKKSDIAVLRTMGMTAREVMAIFVFQGCITSAWGLGLGLLLGVPCALYLPEIMTFIEAVFRFQIFDANVYFVTTIPSIWKLADTLVVSGFAALSSFLATLYPAYRASMVEPAEAMRYDS